MKIWFLESGSLGQEYLLYGKKNEYMKRDIVLQENPPILYVPKCSMSVGLARVVVRIILWPFA